MVNLITKDQVVVEIGKLLSELLSPTISDHWPLILMKNERSSSVHLL
jgi:hypothetical protein